MKLIRRLQHHGSTAADIAAAVLALALLTAAGAELSWPARGLPIVALLFLGRLPEAILGPERPWASPAHWLPALVVVGGTALIWWWFFAVPGATALQWVALSGILRELTGRGTPVPFRLAPVPGAPSLNRRHGAGSAGAAFTGRILAIEAAPPASPPR